MGRHADDRAKIPDEVRLIVIAEVSGQPCLILLAKFLEREARRWMGWSQSDSDHFFARDDRRLNQNTARRLMPLKDVEG